MTEVARHYYASREPFGRQGDFVTAPEISQMFGELLGLWAAQTWLQMGRPDPVLLVELGPGRGSLMADAWRAAGVMPEFAAAIRLHLVENSPRLRALQAKSLAAAKPVWHDDIETIPAGPFILLANEFFDALPIRQFVRAGTGWHERMVGLDEDEALQFVLSADATPVEHLLAPAVAAAPPGSIAEICPAAQAILAALARRMCSAPGAALIVDYGPPCSGSGDSLQAVRAHRYHPVLQNPGSADLTAHVDFAALGRAAAAVGARVHGPLAQGEFLRRLGIDQRAARLRQAAGADAAAIERARERLTAPEAMGTLFQAMAVTAPDLPAPAGFEA